MSDVPLRSGSGDGLPADGGRLPADCREEELGVAFFDLSRLAEWSSSDEDARVAAFLQELYRLAAERLEPAGVRLVKLMGDAGLAVFAPEDGEGAIEALAQLCREARELALACGFDAWLNANVHVGPVLSGSFGPAGHERYDVIGKTVNTAARLGRRGLTLSPQAFRCLSKEARERFEKVKPAVTYRFSF
jgi:class 3 adenylate cyclase